MIEVVTKSKNQIMLKSILNLKGAKQLSKKEQKSIKGSGIPYCYGLEILICCPDGSCVCAMPGMECMLS